MTAIHPVFAAFFRLVDRISVGAPPRVIDRHFAWLREAGFRVTTPARVGMAHEAMYASDAVLVRVIYDHHYGEVDVTLARRRAHDPQAEPYWAQVHLDELLARRVPGLRWDGAVRHGKPEPKLAEAARLIRRHASDLIDGTYLGLLDEVVAARPRRGVAGIDFPPDDDPNAQSSR